MKGLPGVKGESIVCPEGAEPPVVWFSKFCGGASIDFSCDTLDDRVAVGLMVPSGLTDVVCGGLAGLIWIGR